MNALECIVVASLTSIMTVVGLHELGPEARELADQVQEAARIKGWELEYGSEISGHQLVPVSPIGADEISAAVEFAKENEGMDTQELEKTNL